MKSATILYFVFLYKYLLHVHVKANNFMPVNEAEVTSKPTLKLTHVLFRHGIRTPVNTYRNDPYKNETFFPFGWGHLTNDGKRDLYQMGQWLSARYVDFIAYYNPDEVYARSTASPRTLMSMSTVLAGMFPPIKTPMEWNSELNWQPIPISTQPLKEDISLRMETECDAYTELKNNVKVIESPEGLFEELKFLTGENVTSASDVNSIFITLWAEQLYGLKLPDWSLDYFPEKMRFMAEQSYANLVDSIEMQRLKAGPFLEMLTKQLMAKASGTLDPKNRKIFLYSAHDWTITNILISLKVWKRQMPDFAALILFEMHQNPETNEYFLEIYFQNGPQNSVESLTLPGCDFQCPLNKVLDLLQDILPTDTYENMCKI